MDIRQLLLLQPPQVSLHFGLVWFRGNQKQTPPIHKKVKYLTPSAFVILFLGPHSTEFNFYGIYFEQYLFFATAVSGALLALDIVLVLCVHVYQSFVPLIFLS